MTRLAGVVAIAAVSLLVVFVGVLVGDAMVRPIPPSEVSAVRPAPLTTSTSSTTTTEPIAAAPTSTTGVPITERDEWSWSELADCESGQWVRHADGSVSIVPGSADWSSADGVHEGGLQFAPSTWDGNKPAGFPDGAHEATAEQQVVVAEIVLARYGAGQWPTCGPMVGLR